MAPVSSLYLSSDQHQTSSYHFPHPASKMPPKYAVTKGGVSSFEDHELMIWTAAVEQQQKKLDELDAEVRQMREGDEAHTLVRLLGKTRQD
jgi:hypothetical protein